ncbi:hypothetical protein Q1695_004524 [Nippostrongylus brasiliensis]|nr:hypothetical protein Q1695_004524 [Nippostrongylus brasiliensis]
MWIFGYGSLLWNPNFQFEKKVPGVVKGYARRFWQLSPDHRGTPTKPGRTVTLVPDENSVCWGLAFKIAAEHVVATKKYLDFREKAGYSLVKMMFKPDDTSMDSFEVQAYMSLGDEHHAGPSDLEETCRTIVESEGPSGPNVEYALLLAKVLHEQASHVPDHHVFEIERRVVELCEKSGTRLDILERLGYIDANPTAVLESLARDKVKNQINSNLHQPSLVPISTMSNGQEIPKNENEHLLSRSRSEISPTKSMDSDTGAEAFHLKRPVSIGGLVVEEKAGMDVAPTTTKKKLSETRQVNLPKITVPERPAVSFADPPSATLKRTPPLSISPIGHTLHHIPQSADYRKKKNDVVSMRVYISQFVRMDRPEPEDGDYAGIQFNIPGGRNATADYIVELMAAEYHIDRAIANEAFSLWMVSELLEVQLKPHHKPYEMRRGWGEVLEKFATSEPEHLKRDDEPVLYFRRNVQLSETREQQIVTFCSRSLEMLLTDARSSLFLGRCPMPPERAAELAGLGFAMEDGTFDNKVHNVDWLRIHIEDQLPARMADVIRGPLLLGKALSGFNELESRVVESWKNASIVLKMNGVDEVRRQYLTKLRESTPCYGAAFFRGLIERPGINPLNLKKVFNYLISGATDTEVIVGVNSEFVTIIDANRHDLLLVQRIRDCTWRKLIYSPDEIKKGHQHLLFLSFPDDDYIKSRNDFLVGKAENLANMKMNILHIFSSQTMLLNAMLNSVKSNLGDEETVLSEELVTDQTRASSTGYPVSGRVTVARTPSQSKCHRMCLASFEDGKFVKAKGTFKKVDWATVQRGVEVVL